MMIANQPLSRRINRKRKADNGNDRSMDDGARKSSSKRLKTIGDYRAALYTKQVSSKVSRKVGDIKKHLLRKTAAPKIIKKAPAKLTQPTCEEVPTLEDITPILLSYNYKEPKIDEEPERVYKFVLGKKRLSLYHYQQKWLNSWQ